MNVKKLSLEDAWKHIKALFPQAILIKKEGSFAIVKLDPDRHVTSSVLLGNIEWGGMDQYPPDPGDGWRLLDKSEPVKEGDEYFDDGKWNFSNNYKHRKGQSVGFQYRRRVPPEIRPYTFNEIVYCIANGHDETCCGYIVGINQSYVTFKKNDITETRALSDTSDITWADGKPFGQEVKP